jgi:F0F1-type ATP synthase assembly protein I
MEPPKNSPQDSKQKSTWAKVGDYASIGVMLPACTVVGYFLGVLLDHWLGTHFLYIVFLLVGIAAGFLEFYKIVTRD